MRWRGWLWLIGWVRLASCADLDPEILLSRVRAKIVDDAKRIPRYVCRQQIERRVYFPDSKKLQDCASILAQRSENPLAGLHLGSLDRARLNVMLTDRGELFSWPGGYRFDSDNPGDLLAGGMSGSGDFASFPIAILTNARVAIQYQGTCGRASCARFSYDFPQAASHFVLATPWDRATVGYHGTLEVDSGTAELLSVTVIPTDLRQTLPDVCVLTTHMTYARTKMEAGDFMMPALTQKDLTLENGSFFENKDSYQGCRQYSTESVLAFGDESSASPAAAPARRNPSPPAPGTKVDLRLISKIDFETNFAGDTIEAALIHPIRVPGGGLIPAGSVVRGHLAQMQRQHSPSNEFFVALRFDSLVLGGTPVPLALEPLGRADPRGRGLFVFPATRTALGKEFVSHWRVRSSPS